MTWAIVGGVVAALAAIGLIVARRERQRAPARLALAEEALARGDLQGALKLAKEAFFVAAGEHLTIEDAKLGLRAVELVEQVVQKLGADPLTLTGRLKGELKAAASSAGAAIGADIVGPVRRFLDGDPDHWLAGALQKRAPGAAAPAAGGGDSPITDPDAQAKVVNQVGRSLVLNKVDDALHTLDTHLVRAVGEFRATLLDQRGDANAMKQDHAAAAADYAEAAALQPDNAAHHSSLAGAYELLGRTADAIGAAKRALDLHPVASARQAAEGILRRLTGGG
jgi:tetratricopeptide (TPR) repeat protein